MPVSEKNISLSVKFLAALVGAVSVISQSLILRELVTVFYGNEIVYAVVLSAWLFWVAVGSFLASRFVQRITSPQVAIAVALGVVAILIPCEIIAIRLLPQIMHIPTGMIVGIVPIVAAAYVAAAPVTILFGALFVLLCAAASKEQTDRDDASAAALIYFWEAVGAAGGGFVGAVVLVPFFHALSIAWVLAACCAGVVWLLWNRTTTSIGGKALLAGGFVYLVTLSAALMGNVDTLSRQIQWRGFDVIDVADSRYGNLTLLRDSDTYSFFENGLLSYTTGDALTSEQSVHFPLLAYPDPRRILLIGGGAGGSIAEVLKYPAVTLEYVELDPVTIALSRRYLPAALTTVFDDPAVRTVYQDGRLFMKTTPARYDVIIVNLPGPHTAQINRYYSAEFFKEARSRLTTNGILAIRIASSENYMSEDTLRLLRSINTTLRGVFPQVAALPGETVTFLASTSAVPVSYDAAFFSQQLIGRGIATSYVTPQSLPFQLSPDRVAYLGRALSISGECNSDMRPVAYAYDTINWAAHFNDGFARFLTRVYQLRLWPILACIAVIAVVGMFGFRRARTPIALSIATTGFSEIIFQIIVIFAFQVLYGYVYVMLIGIVAAFMAGLVVGSVLARRQLFAPRQQQYQLYTRLQLAVTIYPLLLPLLFIVFRDGRLSTDLAGVGAIAFALLPIVAGVIGGMQYPLAVALLKEEKGTVALTAGWLYAVDVFGAAVGALIAAVVLIPVLGITQTAVVCAAVNAAVYVLLIKKYS